MSKEFSTGFMDIKKYNESSFLSQIIKKTEKTWQYEHHLDTEKKNTCSKHTCTCTNTPVGGHRDASPAGMKSLCPPPTPHEASYFTQHDFQVLSSCRWLHAGLQPTQFNLKCISAFPYFRWGRKGTVCTWYIQYVKVNPWRINLACCCHNPLSLSVCHPVVRGRSRRS